MSYVAVDLAQHLHPIDLHDQMKKMHAVDEMAFHHHEDTAHFVIVRAPDSCLLKLLARAVLLALLIVSFPRLWLIYRGLSSDIDAEGGKYDAQNVFDPINAEMLSLLFHDLTNEGLLKFGDRALFISNGNDSAIYKCHSISSTKMDSISFADSEQQKLTADESYDFAFMHEFQANEASEFVDRALKVGGTVIVQLSDNPMAAFQKPSNYKIVYFRRFDSTIMALRKTSTNSPSQRRLCALSVEKKKAALKKLENVLLEPPRSASGKSRRYLKKTRYLPDLMGDNLESYPRRIFIDVGLPDKNDAAADVGWFAEHYPTRNKDFDIYKIETVTEESSGREITQIGMSDWLSKNVRNNEYVVMKAEADVVEEMVRSKAIRLVDELFLECNHQGIKSGKRNKRAYWECLALYGRLRDEGVAVHQWWG